MERKENLNNFIVGNLPTLFYIPNFVNDSEQAQLLNNIYQAPVSKWKSLKNRRLQNWGGVVHEKGLLPQDLPPWLSKITERICEESGLFPSAINHVLINEYLPNQGIMPHQDGPAYYPVVAILSLGSPAVMDFTPHSRLDSCKNYLHGNEDNKVHRLDKVVNENEALTRSTSSDAGVIRSEDTKIVNRNEGRISLTCRLVLKGDPPAADYMPSKPVLRQTTSSTAHFASVKSEPMVDSGRQYNEIACLDPNPNPSVILVPDIEISTAFQTVAYLFIGMYVLGVKIPQLLLIVSNFLWA
ncbi:Oxidoreductase, putative isoform 2 [Hibiscus syriacus]|uniref:Oxidoreductase, putative isoform 2 n=1 Tax=Hibiscus syriacus TaxID=106335 RepID=A0A6A2Y4I5_HIBSY|nr:Oxidoreductase, putative isoform 2 [Hibiscus syriacus]